jgi:hypothetical protein
MTETHLMNLRFANSAGLELGLALVRVEPVLLCRQELVFVELPAASLGVVACAGLPRIGNDNLSKV